MCAVSVTRLFMNLRRAGVLKNSSLTSISVPAAQPVGRSSTSCPPSRRMQCPTSSLAGRLRKSSLDTEAMLGSASPRNPIVLIRQRSSMSCSLLVACRSRHRPSSGALIPHPSSKTRMVPKPPPSTSMSTLRAPASSEFSSSSLTTDAGRSTTSPAAIWFTTSVVRTRIGGIGPSAYTRWVQVARRARTGNQIA